MGEIWVGDYCELVMSHHHLLRSTLNCIIAVAEMLFRGTNDFRGVKHPPLLFLKTKIITSEIAAARKNSVVQRILALKNLVTVCV